jgi:hypothetical protein
LLASSHSWFFHQSFLSFFLSFYFVPVHTSWDGGNRECSI